MGLEGALFALRIIYVLLLLLHLPLLLVLLASIDQVILVGHATFLNLLLGDHGLVNLLRLGVNLGFAYHRLAVVSSILHPLLLPFVPLDEHVVRSVEAELLKLFVHLLQLLRTQHVVASLLIDGADERGVWIARLCLGSHLEA